MRNAVASACAGGLLLCIAVASADQSSRPAPSQGAPDTSGFWTAVASPYDVDRFPEITQVESIFRPVDSDAARDPQPRFVICQVALDRSATPLEVLALGCEGVKGALCDEVVRVLAQATFTPALRGDQATDVYIVFPVVFPGNVKQPAVVGIPVVGRWDDRQCGYTDRIYGSAEVPPANGPWILSEVPPAYPGQARQDSISGHAVFRFIVDSGGKVCFVLCDQAYPQGLGFVEAGTRALFMRDYHPATLRDDTVAVWLAEPIYWRP